MKSAKGITGKAGPVAAVLALLLPSCGGEDSPGQPTAVSPTPGPSSVPAPTPSPTPSPVPPPATTELPPAPFGITGDTSFSLLGWQLRSDGADTEPVYALAAERGSLAWSADRKTYAIDLADLVSGKLVYTFGSSRNNAAFSIVRPDGSIGLAYVSLFVRSPNMGEIYWRTADWLQPYYYAHALFGLPVPPGGLPVSGKRIFDTDNSQEHRIVFDFATRRVSGALATMYQDSWSEGPPEVATLLPADIQPDGTFVAEVSITGSDRKGELRGRLFGVAANELGLFLNAPLRDGYGGRSDFRTVIRFDACSGC